MLSLPSSRRRKNQAIRSTRKSREKEESVRARSHHPETEIVGAGIRKASAAQGHAAICWTIAPRPTTQYVPTSGAGARRIFDLAFIVITVAVITPLRCIAYHVIKPERVGLEASHR
jgi:hypothetical protein